MAKVFFICSIAFGFVWLGAIAIWILWIRPYLERYTQKSGFLLCQSALLLDYRVAVDVARRQGSKPWFLKAFSILAVTGILFFLCGLLATILGEVFG